MTVPAGPLDPAEDEPELDLHVAAAGTVVDHRAVGADPHVALAPDRCRAALGMGPEHGILAGRHLGLDAGALLGDPGMELAVADRETAQLVERPRRPGIGQLGDEEESSLPDPERVLHAGCQAEHLVERHDLGGTGATAIAPTGEADLTREGHDASRRPTVGLHDAAAADVATAHHERPFERADELRPQLPGHVGQADTHRPFQRADVGTLGLQFEGERDRDGDRLHDEPLRVLVVDKPSLSRGSSHGGANQHRRLDAYFGRG